jgi:hypothetical protein
VAITAFFIYLFIFINQPLFWQTQCELKTTACIQKELGGGVLSTALNLQEGIAPNKTGISKLLLPPCHPQCFSNCIEVIFQWSSRNEISYFGQNTSLEHIHFLHRGISVLSLKTLLSLFEGVVRCQHLVPLKIGSFLLF